jgi:hypothetical protein
MGWPPDHDAALKAHLAAGKSHSEAADQINADFGTAYTRNACCGRSYRQHHPRPQAGLPRPSSGGHAAKQKRQAARRREKRWAVNPSLKERWERMQQQKATRAMMAAKGTPATAACYRKHMPRLPEMTKYELRRMLTAAVVATAAMEIAL